MVLSQTDVTELPHTQTPVTVPVCDMCHLPQLYDVSPTSWLNVPGAAAASQTESSQSQDVERHPVMEQLPSSPPVYILTVDFCHFMQTEQSLISQRCL